ncbi:hypothetical protein [Arthrobacter sp. 260]|uniref:DUF4097 family beta strand repeat-containing protein n=1 Tax=Arthrobacter sp. 260 TaxID=2735314 RepID=UPI0014909DF8|nr:hypothetical protein [Arthrobacter sp. 260]NOJ58613.1 hypothetical protein [Arthrobacter sp. 260]
MENQQWSVNSPQTIEIDGVQRLRAGIVAGRVDILVHDEPSTLVEVSEVDGQPLELTLTNGLLELRHQSAAGRGLGWLGFQGQIMTGRTRETAVISIAVPAGTQVVLHTVTGDGMACGTQDTRLDTVSGSILADDTTGTLAVSTVSGEAIVRHHTGTLAAKSVSGEVTISGYLESATANTVSGGMSLDLLGTPRELNAKTVSGELTVRVPEEVGIDLTFSSVSGGVTVNDQSLKGKGKTFHGEPGTTGQRMVMRTRSVSGSVAIFHRTPDTGRLRSPQANGLNDEAH